MEALAQLHRASDLVEPRPAGRWDLEALRGRLTELVGGATSANVSVASRLMVQAQRAGELVAWVASHRDAFFPPDLAAAGVDLQALLVIWAVEPEVARPAPGERSAVRATRSAERMIRSGACGLVIIDLARELSISTAAQGRLLRLAEQHKSHVLILRRARSDGNYSGTLVSVRGESSRERVAPGRFTCTITNTKDKREGPGWTVSEEFNGPPGLY
ncbi:MAG: hypothetical protein ACLFP4_10455 [Spirochaetales bacterium]